MDSRNAFLSEYFTNFKFVQNIGKLSVPLASTMSFAMADSKCRPGHSPEDELGSTSLLEWRSTQRKAQLRVDASKLRVSSLVFKKVRYLRTRKTGRPAVLEGSARSTARWHSQSSSLQPVRVGVTAGLSICFHWLRPRR